ncbi:putative hemin transport protein [Halopseudomonas salegens]|uniref:Putative hemin transport protein n=2 Tax=Halopseudomonas salegens TaxID=1434072 RepID=A0A1H2DW13_9GAMM|nr:putative hemin transport protein [Halopseudomonas salegens]
MVDRCRPGCRFRCTLHCASHTAGAPIKGNDMEMMMQDTGSLFAGQDLLDAWQRLRERQPRLRIRDAAARLNVSEAELLFASQGERVVRLQPNWRLMFETLPAMGEVMALTRNEHCVHERHGCYDNISFSRNGQIGLVVNGAIDLRLFMQGWSSLFAVSEPLTEGKWRRSLQVFDRQGKAIHKIFLTDASDVFVWARLCEQLKDEGLPALTIEPEPEGAVEYMDAQIDQAALQADWAALKDTHHFFAMLGRHHVTRTQALRLAGRRWAEPLATSALVDTLQGCAGSGLEIMVFVGNRGCIQIHTGAIERVVRTGDWFNVLDPAFNLHLRDGAIAGLWRVRKPTADGIVTSLEAYDQDGELIVQLFGARKPGMAELIDWRTLVESHAAA